MIASLQSVVTKAQRGRYAVGAFNVSDLEQAQAVIAAAKQLRSPAIINTSESAIEYAGLEEISTLVRVMGRKVNVPIVLNLDHGKQVPLAVACLRNGYSGIMFDGSRYSYRKNVRDTSTVVRAARRFKVGVEGEIGQVQFVEDAKKPGAGAAFTKTDPDQAVQFVRMTGICALAVAIGNAHGLPQADERLDFPLLKRIAARVRVPLVLHGASGTPPAAIRRAISLGVAKINIDTDLRLAFTAALRRAFAADPKLWDPRKELSLARVGVFEVVKQKMITFGSIKRA